MAAHKCLNNIMTVKNMKRQSLFPHYMLVMIMLSVIPYFPHNFLSFASDPTEISNQFTTSKEICNDGIDNDGNGFIDDNCGTASLDASRNMSGYVTNISSICHEDCGLEGDDK